MPSLGLEQTEGFQPIFQRDNVRILFLDGNKGTVGCQVFGQLTSGTLPCRSNKGRIECATRSLMRMKNLAAVRGERAGARMVGPAHYLGNLENPHEHAYMIDIQEGLPMFLETPLHSLSPLSRPDIKIPEGITTTVQATWTCGKDKEAIRAKKDIYARDDNPTFGESLFPDSGILEILDGNEITLPEFDPRGIDLSPFKARLVQNDRPFQISYEPLQPSDEFRAVTFLYEPDYGKEQVRRGGGLFLEKHDFAQTMTPMDQAAKGFVSLAKWVDVEQTRLEIIAIRIPFGWTLIIDRDCIHGDATLDGMFMMCMTSNHTTMKTADSVFLKNPQSKANVLLKVDAASNAKDEHVAIQQPPSATAPRPLVLHADDDHDAINAFINRTRGMNFIFNPFSLGYWRLTFGIMSQNLSVAGVFFAAIGRCLVDFFSSVAAMLTFSKANQAAKTTSGQGFFDRTLQNGRHYSACPDIADSALIC
jgi:hypothetical protein